jgi:hypothetical protein
LGKKVKLARRGAALARHASRDPDELPGRIENLYRMRSQSLHDGFTNIDEDDIRFAHELTSLVIESMLENPAYAACESLQELVALIDPTEQPFCYII